MSGITGLEPRPKGQPRGLWVLIFTETWERFSHYGMRALLILYLTTPLALGGMGLDKARAAAILGGYMLSIYLFGLNGGQIADRFLGAKRTIVLGGLFIAAGQLLLQVHSLHGLLGSLTLIAIGTCLMKPNISASVGRLYTLDDPRRDGAFTLEYMGINLGALVAPIICGFMAESMGFLTFLHRVHLDSATGWSWAFGVSGLGMLLGLANFAFRHKLVRDVMAEGQGEEAPRGLAFVLALILVLLGLAWMVVSAKDWKIQLILGAGSAAAIMALVQFVINRGLVAVRAAAPSEASPEASSEVQAPPPAENRNWLFVVFMMICFSITFWFVFQQAGSSLNLFAKAFTNRHLGALAVPASWVQSINAVGIVVLGPVFAWIWTRRSGRWPSSPIKFALGLLFAALGFLLLVPASRMAQAVPGQVSRVGMGWLGGVYLMHTIGELCLSPVGLSYVSKLAPKHMSSQLMGAWFFATGLGSYLAGKAAGFMDSVPLWKIYGFGAAVALGMCLLLWLVVSRIIHKLMGGYS